jgi:hypothetical protein
MNYPAANCGVSSVNVMPVPDLIRDDGSGIQFNFWIPAFAGMTVCSKTFGELKSSRCGLLNPKTE